MRRMLVGSAALLLLAGTSLAAPVPSPRGGPNLVFSGRVSEAGTSQPIAAARVSISGTRHGVMTGADGMYRLVVQRTALPGTQVLLRAERVGYTSQSRSIAVTTADSVTQDFALASSSISLEAVVVTGAEGRAEVIKGAAAATSADVSYAPSPLPAQAMRMRGPAAIGRGHPGQPEWNREQYGLIEENVFLAVGNNPLSTFSIDVDRASYSNVRRFLLSGRRPPRDAVRIEEMINYFPYDYPEPRGPHPVSVTTEVADAPWHAGHKLVRIGVQSPHVDLRDMPPSNLVFLVDVSGSMQSPDKLPLVKQSLRLLVEQIRPQDRVALVVYAGAAGLVLDATPGDRRETILDAIERLEAGGSTAGGAGIRLAYEVARRNHVRGGNNRVILATDGDFNVGASSDAEMVRLIEEKRREGTFLTVLGFGTGNLQDAKMEQMADHGNGNYAYIDNLLEARKVLVQEMGGTLLTVAKDVKLQVEFNPARVQAYRLIGYENRLLADEDFNDDARDAGELGAGHSVTALYEVIPVGVRTDARIRGVDSLRYSIPPRPGARQTGELAFVKIRYKLPDSETSRLMEQAVREGGRAPSADFSFATAVAGFGMLLRDSEHRGTLTLDQVIRMAERSRGRDPQGYRADFIRLARRFGELEGAHDHPPADGR
ncbi:MAG TPA: von Willebrand factor type A domain-containing protein [Longimicrobium sp.]|nr:von Willebrand factor type A domain-containing protein [Longimicrobium sp.]